MQTLNRTALSRAVVILAALVLVALAVSGGDLLAAGAGGFALAVGPALMLPYPISTQDYNQLASRAKPSDANLPEAVPWVLYDTQTYLAAGSSRLEFFRSVNADATLSNMELAGSLPGGVFFDVHRIFLRALRAASVTAVLTAAGAADDLARIINLARGTLTFTFRGKPWGPIPLAFFGAPGAIEATTAGSSAPAAGAAAIVQMGQLAANGGFPMNGSAKLTPQEKFGVTIDFAAPVTAVSADTPLQVSLFGIMYRRLV